MNKEQPLNGNINMAGDKENPDTEQDINDFIDKIRQGPPSDTEMLDWLQKQTQGYGVGWICRNSSTGRGLRLHETSRSEAKPSVREAISDAMNKLFKS